MRFVRVLHSGSSRIGVLNGEGSIAVCSYRDSLSPLFGPENERLLAAGHEILKDPAVELALDEAELLAPVRPTSIRDFTSFEEHLLPIVRRAGLQRLPRVWYEQPVGYFSNPSEVLGPTERVIRPGGCTDLDFELEIGAVVGVDCRSISATDAAPCIAGYLIFCDWSARDLQMREMEGNLGPFKGKDFASSLGGVLITPDELLSRRKQRGYDLAMRSSVNGNPYGVGYWSDTYWSFEEMLSYASWNSSVEVGGLIGSGTSPGGCIGELAARYGQDRFPWLRTGDLVELSVDLLGSIRTNVGPAQRGAWPHRRSDPQGAVP